VRPSGFDESCRITGKRVSLVTPGFSTGNLGSRAETSSHLDVRIEPDVRIDRGRLRPVTLTVDTADEGPWTVLFIRGELDLVTSPEVRRHVHQAVAVGRRELVLDLSEVSFCDSSGVGVLIATRRLLRACQGRLHVILPERGAQEASHVNRVLGALGVHRLFDVYPDVSTAVDDKAQPLSV
jgi:anti-anti-sigma factor